MSVDYKNKIMSKVYLISISLIVAAVLLVGTAFARYLTQSEHNVGFVAEKPTKIYLNDEELLNKTLFQPQMTQIDGEITSIFTLKSFETEEGDEQKPIKFKLKAFVVRNEDYAPVEDAPPVQITLSDSVNSLPYSSKAETVNKKTDFYKTNQKNGQYFSFYEPQQQALEKIYTLGGQQNSEITFTITAKDIDFAVNDLYVCVELVK